MAIQALYRAPLRMIYYTRIIEFDVPSVSVTTNESPEVLIPQRHRPGFDAGMIVITLHLLLPLILRLTLLGEGWHVVTQMWSLETLHEPNT